MDITDRPDLEKWRFLHIVLAIANCALAVGCIVVIEGLPNNLSENAILNFLLGIDLFGSLGFGFGTAMLAIEYNRELMTI